MTELKRSRSFLRSRNGNVAVISALVAVPLLGIVAGAVDFQMAISERTRMQDALDAATLEVMARAARATGEDRAERLQRSYAANGGRGTATIVSDLDPGAQRLSIDTQATQEVPTHLLGLVGLSTINLGVDAASGGAPRVEAADFRLVDVSGTFDKSATLFGVPTGSSEPVELARIRFFWNSAGTEQHTIMEVLDNGNWIETYHRTNYRPRNSGSFNRTRESGSRDTRVQLSRFQNFFMRIEIGFTSPNAVYMRNAGWGNVPSPITTNDPRHMNFLFVDGVQQQENSTVESFRVVPCGTWVRHSWEDGGSYRAGGPYTGTLPGVSEADFHYEFRGLCSYDSPVAVRLTR